MDPYQPGAKVRITDIVSKYYGDVGTIDREGETGGLYVKQSNGKIVYHPWGYQLV